MESGEDGKEKRAAIFIFIGPEYGTVTRPDLEVMKAFRV